MVASSAMTTRSPAPGSGAVIASISAVTASRAISSSCRLIGVPVPLALIAASHRGSAAGSGRGTARPVWLILLGLDCVEVVTPVAVRTETSSALLARPWLLAFASGEVDALVMVRSKALVLDDIASGPPWLMELDCVGVVGPAAAISETSPSLGCVTQVRLGYPLVPLW